MGTLALRGRSKPAVLAGEDHDMGMVDLSMSGSVEKSRLGGFARFLLAAVDSLPVAVRIT